jgi:hypothetical protein
LNREKKRPVYATMMMTSPNVLSSGLLAVFDLPGGVEPPVARGERRERRGRVRTGESERGELAVRGIMARLLEASRHLPPFPTCAAFPPTALDSAWLRKMAKSSVLIGQIFPASGLL